MTDTVFEPTQINNPTSASFAVSSATCQVPCSTSAYIYNQGSDFTAASTAQKLRLQPRRPDPELEAKVKKACERISENLHISANEPSLAFYRLAEHVRKALPPTVESRRDVRRLHRQLRGAHTDAEDALECVHSMGKAVPTLSSARDLLQNAIVLQQQILQEQQKNRGIDRVARRQSLSFRKT